MKDLTLRSPVDSAAFILGTLLALAFLLLPLRGRAQSGSDVHVVPNGMSERDGLNRIPGATQIDGVGDIHIMPLSVRVEVVQVPVTVRDGLNRPIMGLGKEDFAVFEDDKLQRVRYFSAEDAPISIGIILDVSGSMTNKIEAVHEGLAEFFKNCHPDDDYFVITFSDRPELLADSTRSVGYIQGKLLTVKPYGYTALLDAVQMGIEKLRSARYSRRALLLISDGGDNSSRNKLRGVKSLIEESGVLIYAIGLFDDGLPLVKSFEEKLGKHLLSQLTEASGGRTLTVENLARLPEVATTISQEMRSQYLLGYQPTNSAHDGRWHKIKIRVTRNGDTGPSLHPVYKKGYLAPRY